MGMSAEVIAIGPFQRHLVPYLRHPPERYVATREGATLVESVMSTTEGTARSRALAACLGIDPWDFNAHAIDPFRLLRADVDALYLLFAREATCSVHRLPGRQATCEGCERASPVTKLLHLRAAGYTFYFRPNG